MFTLIAKVALFLARLIVPEKLVLTDNVITNMTGNGAFPAPNPTLTMLSEQRILVNQKYMAVVETETTLSMQRTELQQEERKLDLMLTALSRYCESHCNNDPAILESSGFPLQQVPTPVGPLPAPTGLRSAAGEMPQTANLRWNALRGAKSWKAECASSPTGPWTLFYTGTKARCTATALTSGALYYFRVAGIGAAGQGPWSDISEKRAP
jgi:hypothetical protein